MTINNKEELSKKADQVKEEVENSILSQLGVAKGDVIRYIGRNKKIIIIVTGARLYYKDKDIEPEILGTVLMIGDKIRFEEDFYSGIQYISDIEILRSEDIGEILFGIPKSKPSPEKVE